MVDTTLFSQKLKRAFDRSASSYNEHAYFQRAAAQHLSLFLENSNLSPQTLLEIGSGTGICSEILRKKYPSAHFWITDTSWTMLQQNHYGDLKWGMDGEALCLHPSVDLIVSGLAFQWFQHPQDAIQRLLTKTRRLIFTVPLLGTFGEWRNWCHMNHLPENLLPFYPPDVWMGNHQGFFHTVDLVHRFSSPWAFVRSLKGLGAHTSPSLSGQGLFPLRRDHNAFTVTFKLGLFNLEGTR